MKILLVIDQFDRGNNGTTMTAQRLAQTLREHNNEVRIVSTGESGNYKYLVREYVLPPIVSRIVHKQGMVLAKPDDEVFREALCWAELVHFLMPFYLSVRGLRIAQEMGVPHTAAFHVQPENITYTLHLGKKGSINAALYRFFWKCFYNQFRHIHCPSEFIARELVKNGFTSKLHVISNGVDRDFIYRKQPKADNTKDKFIILMVGRLSNEKRQDVLIEAIGKSKYEPKIQLVLAGQGLKYGKYRYLGRKLTNKPIMKFYSHEELLQLLSETDLYVHAADAEIEAISCIEAFSSGIVPVIADSPKSATPQFALDERSLFRAGDSGELAGRIDYWLDHPQERRKMERVYSEHGKKFALDGCVRQMEGMFEAELADWRKEHPLESEAEKEKEGSEEKHLVRMWTPFSFHVRDKYRFFPENPVYTGLQSLLLHLIYILVSLIAIPFWGLRVKGRENLKKVKGGAVTVCNHVHLLDSVMLAFILRPRKVCFPTLESNFRIPVVRHLIRVLGAVPIPEDKKNFKRLMDALAERVRTGKTVHFYPEAVLHPYYQGIRGFKRGAFMVACEGDVPVIPIVISYRHPVHGPGKLRRKPCITLRILEPVYPDNTLPSRQRTVQLKEDVYNAMNKVYWK